MYDGRNEVGVGLLARPLDEPGGALELHPGGEPPYPRTPSGTGPSDLADSGTDVA